MRKNAQSKGLLEGKIQGKGGMVNRSKKGHIMRSGGGGRSRCGPLQAVFDDRGMLSKS